MAMETSWTDEGDGLINVQITATGWIGVLNSLRESGHDVESCDCRLCPKARTAVANIYYTKCAFCGEHIEAPYIKNSRILHCATCHRKRCSPTARPCEGGPVGRQLVQEPELGDPPRFNPVPFARMSGWPGTPSPVRLQEALAHLEVGSPDSTPQVLADADRLQRADYLYRWGESISQKALSYDPAEDEGDFLRQNGFFGDTEDTVGIVVYDDYSAKNGTVTRIMRDPEWMGVNPVLEQLRGMHVQIEESYDRPDRPGLVSVKQDPWPEEEEEVHFPTGEAETLRQIILWHGAAQCQWHSLSQGTHDEDEYEEL